ncbi:MAG: hypothetical protein HZB39_09280 [Planctomycetes bacterium]|nr:hypothetical protein [Planctomycetota bacterium]
MNGARLLTTVTAIVLSAAALLAQHDPAPERATVGAAYFYWYRHPDEHCGGEGREGLLHRFVEPEAVSYESRAWHRRELADMAAAAIDVALAVYWGYPGCEDRGNVRFSVVGLPPLVAALDAMDQDRAAHPRIGLFYDTSTLANDVRGASPRGERTDLTTEAGRALFCETVIGFFERVPLRHWGRHRGRPLVVLYTSGFAARWDDSLGETLRTRFAKRFDGEHPFLVADASWGDVGQDATTAWGAALAGALVNEQPKGITVAQVGPGYDDSPVPGRRTPIRPREDGAFYRSSWHAAIASRPEFVVIETWNEMHEGTDVCRTVETGDAYLRMTRDAVERLHRGEPGPLVPLRFDAPQPRPDPSWGGDARDRASVKWTPATTAGLRPIAWEDGPVKIDSDAAHADCPAGRPCSYVYFQVADAWRFDTDADLELVLEGAGLASITVHFDSHERSAPLAGAYADALGIERSADRAVFRLPRARLSNRQNGGADLRLVFQGAIAVTSAVIAPVAR